MNDDALYKIAQELGRLNDMLELLFGLSPAATAKPPFAREVQRLIDDDDALRGRGVWAAADASGQVHICVRNGFMQPPQCFPVESVEDAAAYLTGVRRARGR